MKTQRNDLINLFFLLHLLEAIKRNLSYIIVS